MQFLYFFGLGLLIANFGEYWVHRLQHLHMVKGNDHADHHRDNAARGVAKEFWGYLKPSLLPLAVIGYGCSWFGVAAVAGWVMGVVLAIAFSAVTHEVQHTNSFLVFWSKPLHHFHHNITPNHNFGFNFSLWDRMFGTYKSVPWPWLPVPWRDYRNVKWF
jgi:sterol desaturase/sphingolipid hydroxylase (fatty acid hydroxylase superfamily)